MEKKKIKPEDNAANMKNGNAGNPGENLQFKQARENREKQVRENNSKKK